MLIDSVRSEMILEMTSETSNDLPKMASHNGAIVNTTGLRRSGALCEWQARQRFRNFQAHRKWPDLTWISSDFELSEAFLLSRSAHTQQDGKEDSICATNGMRDLPDGRLNHGR